MSVERLDNVKEKDPPSGRPWQTKGVFPDFESADKFRSEILKSGKYEAKVKRLAFDKFVVKERKKVSSKVKPKKGKKKR